MAWNVDPSRESSSPDGERWRRLILIVLAGLAAIAAALSFVDGESLPGAGKLTLAFLLTLLAVKGPQLRSSSAVGPKLLVTGTVLLYMVLYIVPEIVALLR